MSVVALAAPLAGWATRLDEVPDPAFAQGMVGDGVAIDPTSNQLCAPCDGVVVSVHRARHACTLRGDDGAEILLHIGVDTVELRGEGFEVLVTAGQRVRTGDPLIRFDLDRIVRRAKSLLTMVLLIGGEGLAVIERVVDREVAVGDRLLMIGGGDGRAAGPGATNGHAAASAERRVRVGIAHGLHARPAAAFARRARQHAGEVTVACRGRTANGKSMTALMALDARLGDDLTIAASGPRGEAAASELAALVLAGFDDTNSLAERAAPGAAIAAAPGAAIAAAPGVRTTAPAPAAAVAWLPAGHEVVLDGAAAAPGLAAGRVVRLADAASPEVARDGAGAGIERARLAAALAGVRDELARTIAGAQGSGAAAAGDIFRAHLDLLDDPDLAAAADRQIADGRSAAWAWHSALGELAAALRGLGNPLLAERTADLADLERRALAQLAGGAAGRLPAALPEGAVLVADELWPSELAALPPGRVAALCTARGGATSHVAILAAGLGLPAVVALGDGAQRIPDGAPVIVDGDRGRIRVFPAAATRAQADRAIAERTARRRAALAHAHEPARTSDGAAIAVQANLGAAGDAAGALGHGADGCGLLRTEFLFLDRATAPSEDEQAARYQQIADALGHRPLVIRTLDAGGDKPLAYLRHDPEDNPALGVRGIRLALRHPALLRTQLRAILRVRPAGVCRVMLPMVTSLAELAAVRAMLDDERRAQGAPPVALGAMIEVPAAALTSGALSAEAEFFSIGTNDLAQYALAIDRASRDLAGELTALHPGVLRLIASAVGGAAVRGRPVAVCGGAAGDPRAVPLLIGLGVRSLSVAPAAIPEIKRLVRTLSAARCAEIAIASLSLDSAGAVRALVDSQFAELAPSAPLANVADFAHTA
jgi:phosphoenolpyruvate-protein phosphotransferase